MSRRKLSRFQYMAQDILVDDEDAILMMNGHGQIMSKEDFEELVRLGQRFYGSDDVTEWILEQNRINRWLGHPLLGTARVDGKYVLPEPQLEERAYRKNLKREWSFTCDWCQEKTTSYPGGSYYRIHESLSRNKTIAGTCCSVACGENLWYDLIIQWVLEEKLTDTFHTDKTVKATPTTD